jgi:hypothetical protein
VPTKYEPIRASKQHSTFATSPLGFVAVVLGTLSGSSKCVYADCLYNTHFVYVLGVVKGRLNSCWEITLGLFDYIIRRPSRIAMTSKPTLDITQHLTSKGSATRKPEQVKATTIETDSANNQKRKRQTRSH